MTWVYLGWGQVQEAASWWLVVLMVAKYPGVSAWWASWQWKTPTGPSFHLYSYQPEPWDTKLNRAIKKHEVTYLKGKDMKICVLTKFQPTPRRVGLTEGKTFSPAPLQNRKRGCWTLTMVHFIKRRRNVIGSVSADGSSMHLRHNPSMGIECQTSGHACSSPLERLPKYWDHLEWRKERKTERNKGGFFSDNCFIINSGSII